MCYIRNLFPKKQVSNNVYRFIMFSSLTKQFIKTIEQSRIWCATSKNISHKNDCNIAQVDFSQTILIILLCLTYWCGVAKCFNFNGNTIPRNTTSKASTTKSYKIVMIRHGESDWNKKNLFCGWYDASLSSKGEY
ncbi:hypothetical protein QTP88_005300 [Uroleucon formosanum]